MANCLLTAPDRNVYIGIHYDKYIRDKLRNVLLPD